MNFSRETIVAAIVGFSLGLAAAWLVWYLPQLNIGKQTPALPSQTTQGKNVVTLETFSLNLDFPADETIATESSVEVSGKTGKGATVVISGPLAEQVFEADKNDGFFKVNVSLEEGANEIVVSAYQVGSDEEKTETRTISYTKEEF